MTFAQVDRSCLFSDERGNLINQRQLVAPFLRRTVQLISDPALRDMPPISCPNLSHLGKIENVMKRNHTCDVFGSAIEVEDIWLMVEVYSPAAFFQQWTFRDCLTIQASVNKTFYHRELLQDFMDRVKDELLHGLEL